tara:strand:+ start:620 stop:772 length:153 start_codon:yes stop_codon:yes gene_type:complete
VNPSDGFVVEDRVKLDMAPFLQQLSQVKCQPLVVGVAPIGGLPGKEIGCD